MTISLLSTPNLTSVLYAPLSRFPVIERFHSDTTIATLFPFPLGTESGSYEERFFNSVAIFNLLLSKVQLA